MKTFILVILSSFLSGCCAFPPEKAPWYDCRPVKSEKAKCADKVGDAKTACYQQVEAVKKSIERQVKN